MTVKDRPQAAKSAIQNLAKERTILANERTLLAYVRTTLTFFIAGVTFIQFFDQFALTVVGWLFIPLSVILMAIGTVSYTRRRRALVKTDDGP